MNNNLNSIKRKAVREAARYTDAAIARAIDVEDDTTRFSPTSDDVPELSTLSIEFENSTGVFEYNQETLYGEVIKTEDGNIRIRVKAKIISESDLSELNLQVSLID